MSTPWPEGGADYEAIRAWRKTVVLATLPLDGSPLLWEELLARAEQQQIQPHAVAGALVELRLEGHVVEERSMGRSWWRRTAGQAEPSTAKHTQASPSTAKQTQAEPSGAKR